MDTMVNKETPPTHVEFVHAIVDDQKTVQPLTDSSGGTSPNMAANESLYQGVSNGSLNGSGFVDSPPVPAFRSPCSSAK
ncbi:unnamed protein product [Soboliphyme baturini]|uniref:PAM2 domain-containing protein n=1 Tax=Soboliphyme baturini TaxID=241478 RepID=A0A183IZ70_9BILA|nr:unnamed protein product [Soboliphyme baturini]